MVMQLNSMEKNIFDNCFDLFHLKREDFDFFYNMVSDCLAEYPFLSHIARETMRLRPPILSMSDGQIKINIKSLAHMHATGCQSGLEIVLDDRYWDTAKYDLDTKQKLAATFWHELVHYTQEKKLIEGCSNI